MINQIDYLINNLRNERYQTKENIKESQEKQRERHNRGYKKKLKFKIREKVLHFNATKRKAINWKTWRKMKRIISYS